MPPPVSTGSHAVGLAGRGVPQTIYLGVVMIFACIGCVLLGFLAGLFSFKVKSQWCQVHGVVKSCAICHLGDVRASLKTPHGSTG